jgi:hypothetical protein
MIHRRSPAVRSRRPSQSGYAYLMALLMIVAMFAASTVFLENALMESRRRREAEMIWRGNQYVRAIRLYFHKTGHYPQDLDALKKGLPQLHFLRQAYKDPINTTDGSWRFIYVNAAGQIIGSTRFASLQQMAFIDNPQLQNQTFPQLGVSASSLASSSSSSSFSAFSSTAPTAPSGTNSTSQNPPAGNTPDNSGGATPPPADQSSSSTSPSPTSPSSQFGGGPGTSPGPLGQSGFSLGTSSSSDQPLQNPILAQKPTGPVDGPVLGAFLTGVASKVDSPSVKWLHHAKKYNEWEFIWNPLDDQAAALQSQGTAIPLLGQPASGSAFGQGFGSVFGQGSGASGQSGSTGLGPSGPGGGMNPFGGPSPQPQPQPQGNPPQ